ncbi:hypothetical protein N7509_007705 [Penicillium cosmopolitanum]|uniref:Uncharacterized protein n=1 Tax=Penicillium cosmopolitanum TaxID=1131564 RepID=A0A9W9VZM0_9EURO|nr:uncharacterized protein N7509_007705 [Penicillium cosmopolitanum]KAJ5392215.1 hypothetical protein N7509_007705 [Penicillium cosmopolitanum]
MNANARASGVTLGVLPSGWSSLDWAIKTERSSASTVMRMVTCGTPTGLRIRVESTSASLPRPRPELRGAPLSVVA